ncbi:GntR family transcriptional regulator [Saccharopolyspora dendranthemae]|uniref:Regulatory GntR family protein n=1 Tax=Saccharopolyspora dendranthemae TaxID=1181886 RepID=A0A561U1G8_9PSEU|nr:GntR family transcriptional regulator [Saccharopolyspora dendranthemae]TWF93209.1 regulatory GntR family protein [Saccharopolyspora dendranthemae]
MWDSRTDRIERDGPVTVWRQIADDLRTDIESGELAAGSRLPSGTELADIYQVATVTAVKAVKALETDGLVIRTQGRGTFVRK